MVTSHRDRLIEEAGRLFGESGFHAVPLDAILRAAGTTKTTFYKHFESKDQLALICLQNCREEWWGWIEEELGQLGAVDPVDRIRGFFRLLNERFEGRSGILCPGFVACGEFPHPSDPRNEFGRESLREIERRLRDWLRQAGSSAADRLATELALMAKGAILHEVANRRGVSAAVAAEMADRLLDQHFSPAEA